MLHVEALRHKGVPGAEVRQEGIHAALVVLSMSRGPIAIALTWDALAEARYWELPQLAGAPVAARCGLPEGLRHTPCVPQTSLTGPAARPRPARPLSPGPALR
jgi:hypothetical protein